MTEVIIRGYLITQNVQMHQNKPRQYDSYSMFYCLFCRGFSLPYFILQVFCTRSVTKI